MLIREDLNFPAGSAGRESRQAAGGAENRSRNRQPADVAAPPEIQLPQSQFDPHLVAAMSKPAAAAAAGAKAVKAIVKCVCFAVVQWRASSEL
jgi:hypothetical protein